uniref:C3H1-type domain-containing protein n=1 Tax=Globisporangium ultimum (strain ATCC 200006 / CBS 805.95 / DAOM BR144) TaxID=431595 RepID=K3WGC1_GLOUD
MLDAANAKNVFLIVHVRPDVTKLAERFKQRAVKVHLQSLPPMLVRTKLLLICLQERIGFSRDGIEELLQICDSKLLPCMEKLHVMFLAQHFISLPNVQKSLSPKRQTTNAPVVPPFQLMILAMNAPLRRCPKCTLIPPCSHISIGMLYDKVQRIRKLYPNQKATDTSSPSSPAVKAAPPSESPLVCPSFLQSGMCRNIQSLGRCRYLHPLDLHTIDTSAIVKRCGVHTLSLPCMHCANLKLLSQALRDEDAKCTQLETQVHALRKKFANVEIQNVLFVRDNAKTMKWGTQKREYDTKLAHIDAQLTRLRKEIDEVSTDLATSHATREQLERDVQCGKSRGTLAQQRRHQHEASSTTTSVITSS